MSGLWLQAGDLSFRDDLKVPSAAPGEALVRVLRAGICSTDLQMIAGYGPFSGVLGHEFVGIVEQGPRDLIGRRVVAEINVACGDCEECARGAGKHCVRRQVIGIRSRDGAFAELIAVPVENLHPVPDRVSNDAAVFVEPLAAALRIAEQVEIAPGQPVLVVGDGRLGQLIARGLAATGARPVVVGRHASKLRRLAEAGIETNAKVPPGRYEVVVDCTGKPAGFETARAAVRPGGALVLKSTYAASLRLDVSTLVVDEVRVIGSRCGPFAAALEMLACGAVEVESLVTSRLPLARGLDAIAEARRPDALKVLIEIVDEA